MTRGEDIKQMCGPREVRGGVEIFGLLVEEEER